MTDRTAIGMGTAATIARVITRGIEATAPTEIVRMATDRTDIARTDTDRTGIGRIVAEAVIIEATVAAGVSVSDIPAGRMVVPPTEFRFTTVTNIHGHRSLRRKPVTGA